jgi:hypothetical protein
MPPPVQSRAAACDVFASSEPHPNEGTVNKAEARSVLNQHVCRLDPDSGHDFVPKCERTAYKGPCLRKSSNELRREPRSLTEAICTTAPTLRDDIFARTPRGANRAQTLRRHAPAEGSAAGQAPRSPIQSEATSGSGEKKPQDLVAS